jgi:hypothetical protein
MVIGDLATHLCRLRNPISVNWSTDLHKPVKDLKYWTSVMWKSGHRCALALFSTTAALAGSNPPVLAHARPAAHATAPRSPGAPPGQVTMVVGDPIQEGF